MCLGLLLPLGLCSAVLAAEPLPRFEDCLRFEWHYPADPRLSAFYLYVSRTSGGYDYAAPAAMVPAIPEMLTHIPCEEIVLPGYGTYYAVVRAISVTGDDDSGPSNEITFTYGPVTGPPPPPPPITPVPPVLPPRPPPPKAPVPPPITFLPPSAGTITETCAWKGTCADGVAQRPPSPFPFPTLPSGGQGSSITDTCQYRGTCGR